MIETLYKIRVRPRGDEGESILFPRQLAELSQIGFRFRRSAYLDRWYLWVLALDGVEIAGPRKLVGGVDLLAGLKHDTRIPPGELFVYSPDREAPTGATVDTEAVLYYRPSTS